jgi:shikimate kinase
MNNLLQGVDIYLIGMMGSGKSTIGKILAQKLNYRFFDTDVLIERVAGQAIAEIFATKGEAYFRDLETQILKEVSTYRSSAIATGGGIIQKPINWSYLRQGLIVWLDVELEILKKRLSEDTDRPLAAKLEFLLEKRRSLYSHADLQIQCLEHQTPEQVANFIIEQIPGMILKKEERE